MVTLAALLACTARSEFWSAAACDCQQGSVCHPEQNRCVAEIEVGCTNNQSFCPSTTNTGDACPSEGSFLPCAEGFDSCEKGCRTCAADLTWGDCCTPTGVERCNALDDDCDGIVDQEGAVDCVVFYRDDDGDRFGLTSDSRCLCSAVGSHSAIASGDCDDNDRLQKPGQTWFADCDNDGSFDGTALVSCLPPVTCADSMSPDGGWSHVDPGVAADCEDEAVTASPNFLESSASANCGDGLDNDCDAFVDSADLDCQPSLVPRNYRSIGTNANVLLNAGTVSIPAGSLIATFSAGATVPANVGLGDQLDVGAETLFILSRDSTTQVTIQTASFSGHLNATYTIVRTFNDLQAWVVARAGDLVTEDRVEVGVAYADGPFVTPTGLAIMRIQGSVTDATHFMRLIVAAGQRHNGTTGTGVLIDGQNSVRYGIAIHDNFTQIAGIELNGFGGTGSGNAAISVNGASNVSIDAVLIHGFDTGASAYAIRVATGASGSSYAIRNSIIYDGDTGIYLAESSSSAVADSCTIYGMARSGVRLTQGSMTVINTISVGSGAADFRDDVAGLVQSYNLSSDTSATGTGSLTLGIAANQFVSVAAGAEDFHLKVGADALGAGNTASVAADIDGQSRPLGSGWDIGADER